MSRLKQKLKVCLLGVAFPLGLLASHAAMASDALPGDAVAPPANVNIALYYNIFSDAGTFGALRGSNYSHNTHISTDINVARYIRTFNVDGFLSGVQVYEPYVTFLGKQEAGIGNIPGVGGGLPAYGAGRADLSRQNGFGQPNFSVFSYLVNDPQSGTYFVVSPWIAPPISSFNKNVSLNPGQNSWTYEIELGFRAVLIGTPTTPNLSVELWSESYMYGDNHNSAYVSPAVSANNIPGAYAGAHFFNPLIPDANPLQRSSATPATFHEQPSQEFRVYLPYEFAPATRAFIAPGLYQSLGGKQTYTLRNGQKVDSGNRTEETQLRLVAATFVSPTIQVMAVGEYDLIAHGQPLNRNFEIRILKFF